MNVHKRMSSESRYTTPARFENWPNEGLFLFAYLKNLLEEQENKQTAQTIERDVRLLGGFLKMKDEDRKDEDV